MIVAVMSPHIECGAGNTVVSMMLSKGLAGMNKKVMLTHTNPQSESFYTYYGLDDYDDKTTTPTQLVKLLDAGAIQPEEITDYCKSVVDGVDIFTNNETNFSDRDMLVFSEFVSGIKEYDFIIYEIDDIESRTAQYVLDKAEIVILNVTQDIVDLKKFKSKGEDIARMCRGKQTIMVCNKFSKTIGTDRAVTKYLGMKTRAHVIHYNNWIRNACNGGRLVELYHQIRAKGSMVVELDKDIQRLSRTVGKAQTSIVKSKNRKRAEAREIDVEEDVQEEQDISGLKKLAAKAEKVIKGKESQEVGGVVDDK